MSEQEFDKDKILERIQKLLALTKSPNENEAALAAQRVQEMLAKYNIHLHEVEKESKTGPKVEKESVLFKWRSPWQRGLRKAVAELYFCEYLYARDYGTSAKSSTGFAKRERHYYIGESHNIKVAILMSDYLVDAIIRLSKQGALKYPANQRVRYRKAFRVACAKRLVWRILDRIQEMKVQQTKTADGTTLPALASMYDQSKQLNKEFIEKDFGKVKTEKNRTRTSSLAGTLEGAEAGATISLSQQVEGQKANAGPALAAPPAKHNDVRVRYWTLTRRWKVERYHVDRISKEWIEVQSYPTEAEANAFKLELETKIKENPHEYV